MSLKVLLTMQLLLLLLHSSKGVSPWNSTLRAEQYRAKSPAAAIANGALKLQWFRASLCFFANSSMSLLQHCICTYNSVPSGLSCRQRLLWARWRVPLRWPGVRASTCHELHRA